MTPGHSNSVACLLTPYTVDDVLTLVREIFPEEEPPARLRLLLEDIFSDQGGNNESP